MALTINHTITGSIDGSYIVLKATNPEADYVAEGIDISGEIDDVDFVLKIGNMQYSSTVVHPNRFKLFFTTGIKLYPSDFGIDVFPDSIYVSTVSISFSPILNEYLSTKTSVLFGITEGDALKFIFDEDWKVSYGINNSSVNNALRIKSWLTSLRLSNDANLPNEGFRILKSIKKAII